MKIAALRRLATLSCVGALLWAPSAWAEAVRGTIVQTQGHISPSCRTVVLKRKDTDAPMSFRILQTGTEDGVLSVTLTALTTGREVEIYYTPGNTSGCGTEPRIEFITIYAQGN